ncbi:hypothetical protein OAH77_04530 [Flavobacteriaceae bacterium]|nr:hypothetical protein [Flavobacteriaceae bacterium]
MLLSFNTINQEFVETLKKHGIKNENLYKSNSDLYAGCHSHKQAIGLMESFKKSYPSSVNSFKPNKGSDMEKYPIAIELAFGCSWLDFVERKNFTTTYYYQKEDSDKKIYITSKALQENGAIMQKELFYLIEQMAYPVLKDGKKVIDLPHRNTSIKNTDWCYDSKEHIK